MYKQISLCKKVFAILFLAACSAETQATTYYVATSGNDNNTGTKTWLPWRHLNYAAGKVKAGDKVYVKAGNYGNEQVVFATDGTAATPILFEGYKNAPGDIVSINWKYGDTLDSSAMPLLDGGDRANGGSGITIHRKYVIVKNFQITNYVTGIDASNSQSISFINIVATAFGDINASYSGRAIVIGTQAYNDTVRNSIVVNAAAEGFSVTGDGNVVENCKAYADDNSTGANSAMDYYIHVAGNYNTVIGCYVERVGNLDHVGHGIDLKTNCEHNKIINCEAVNQQGESFSVRHRGVKYNLIENCIARGGAGLVVRDGASYNTFTRCHTIGCHAVEFFDTAEDGGTQWAGSQNTFENCVFENSPVVIDFRSYDRNSYADSNTFVNCTISGGDYLFNCARTNAENKMINCIVTGVTNYVSGSYPLIFNFAYSDFWNNGFTAPAGSSILNSSPNFINPASGDYHLTSGSPCIDSGTPGSAPSDDFDGTSRPQGPGIDLGAYEYIMAVTGVSDAKQNVLFTCYPNPAVGVIKVNCQCTDCKISTLVFTDISGKIIRSMQRNGSFNEDVDIREWPDGTYFVNLQNEHASKTMKIVKLPQSQGDTLK